MLVSTKLTCDLFQAQSHASDFDETNSESGMSDFSLNHAKLVKLHSRQKRKCLSKTRQAMESALEHGKNVVSAKLGTRARRRQESAAYIESFARLLTIQEEDYQLAPAEESALSKLFEDHSAMQTWQDFIQLNEEDQVLMLEEAARLDAVDDDNEGSEAKCKSNNNSNTNTNGCGISQRSRLCHHCRVAHWGGFSQLHERYRHLLTRRHLPLGWICGIENDLRGHFDAEMTVWEEEEADSYRRLFTHMVAQYLGLRSKSDCVDDTQAHLVIVENPASPQFLPPCRRLIDHLRIAMSRNDL